MGFANLSGPRLEIMLDDVVEHTGKPTTSEARMLRFLLVARVVQLTDLADKAGTTRPTYYQTTYLKCSPTAPLHLPKLYAVFPDIGFGELGYILMIHCSGIL